LAPDGHCKVTDDWTPNRRARQPPRRGNSDQILHLINLLCELVDCPDCKLCAPLRQRAEHLLNEHYGHVSQ
ncbi:MAG: hypothetical protein WBL96_12430, partial [Pseudolabrys sp.]